jgi:hypothetical protein
MDKIVKALCDGDGSTCSTSDDYPTPCTSIEIFDTIWAFVIGYSIVVYCVHEHRNFRHRLRTSCRLADGLCEST